MSCPKNGRLSFPSVHVKELCCVVLGGLHVLSTACVLISVYYLLVLNIDAILIPLWPVWQCGGVRLH